MRYPATAWRVLLALTLALPAAAQQAETEAPERPAPAGASGAEPSAPPETQEIFDRYAQRVVQVQVAEVEGGAKAGIGSGFAVSDVGHIVTNFHVISQVVHHPDRYRAELAQPEGEPLPLRILAFDLANDLALVKADWAVREPFRIASAPLRKGMRIYALGNPYDLGLSIVEGTYNGRLEHSLYEKIHFTGSLNPGMSGGPAILANGRVVGVNVASAGNQVSFLVPGARVRELIERGEEALDPDGYTAELARQLFAYQEDYVARLLAKPFETVRLGGFEAPARLAPHFNCWGDTTHDEDDLYRAVVHDCFTRDSVYVSESHDFSTATVRHHQLRSDELGPARFYELYTEFFEANNSDMWGREEDFTEFRCRTRFVEQSGRVFKTAFCVRRYRKLEGLYDAVFKAAALGDPAAGFETALVLSAVSFENAERLARAYLGAITWSE